MLQRLRQWVNRTAMITSSVLCAVFMIIVIYNVTARYFLGGGIQWYMESSQYLNVWSVFIAGIGICASNDHLRVSITDELLKGKTKAIFRLVAAVCTVAFYICVAYSAYLLASRSRQVISTMGTLKMAYVYWMLPVTAGLSALAALLETICRFTAANEKEEEKEHDHLLVD